MMASTLFDLEQQFPCRSNEIQKLYNLFGETPFVDHVHVYGGPSSGKTTILNKFFKSFNVKYAHIDLIECYTTKILFQTILLKLLLGLELMKCDNVMDFVQLLKENAANLNNSVIIIDNAEKLKTMEFNLLLVLLKLRELTEAEITVIFVSQIVVQKFYPKTIVETIQIHFQQYNKEELLDILLLDYKCAQSLIFTNYNKVFEFNVEFYQNYLNVFLSIFYRACRDFSELRHNSRLNFVKYCEPIINNELKMNDSIGLWRRISPILKNSLELIYLRVSSLKLTNDNLAQCVELPFYAKYLLIAAYLASYNSAKDDKRLFMKNHGKKRKTIRDVKKSSKVNEELCTQLGAKPFTLDRLLAIFYAILNDDKIGFNNNLLIQVSSLVELQLLTALSENGCLLDGPKYKCNVSFGFIQSVAKMVGFNVRKYLSDFCHL